MSDHKEQAEWLMAKAKKYRRSALDPDAAGSNIRKDWAKQADQFMAEAQVHATLAVLEADRELVEARNKIAVLTGIATIAATVYPKGREEN